MTGREPAPLPFEAIVDQARLGVTIASPIRDDTGRVVDFRYDYVNRTGMRILGRGREEVVGRTMVELRVAATGGLLERYVDAYDGGSALVEVFEDRGPEGVRASYDIVASRAGDYLVVGFADITEQVRAREREQQARERMLTAFARVPGGVYGLDRDLRITFVDADAERMFGRRADEVIGLTVPEVEPRFPLEHVALLRHSLDSGEPVAFDFRPQGPGNAWHMVRVFPDDAGLTAFVIPLEPLLRLERRAANIERLESVATLTGGIAHDFNNLMMVISGHASLLADELDDHPEMSEDVEAIVDAARRATELTAKLLSVGRQQVVEPVAVDLSTIVRQRVESYRATAPSGVEVACAVASEPVLVRVDVAELERVLDHLVRNAFEAMPDGGTLRVETERVWFDGEDDALASDAADGWFGVVTVRDDGVGMDADTLARAPEPFFTTRSRAGSSGLGLSVAHGAARQAGGQLTLSSLPGVGTTVRLVLPEAAATDRDPPASVAAARDGDGPPGGSETVLVVDDDPSVRGITERILGDLGYRVVTAADAPQALTVMRDEESVDLLVLDVVMPGDSGDELATSARALVGSVPVLYVSGYTERDAVRSPEEGAGFLAKPFSARDLAERVRQLLDARR